jgi:hypothetical protein
MSTLNELGVHVGVAEGVPVAVGVAVAGAVGVGVNVAVADADGLPVGVAVGVPHATPGMSTAWDRKWASAEGASGV